MDNIKADRRVLTTTISPEGYLVTVYKPAKPRKSEVTWRGGSRYSIATRGRKAIANGRGGITSTVSYKI